MKGLLFLACLAAIAPALVHCGSDTCDNANSMLTSCATVITTPTSSSSSSSSGGVFDPTSCDGASACKAKCVLGFSCAQINGNDPSYTACLTNCNGI